MKIQSKITSFFLILFLISILFLSIITFSNFKLNLENQINIQLQETSNNLERNIGTFVDAQKNKIELVVAQGALSNEELMAMVKLDSSFYELYVLDSFGKIIFSSNYAHIGLDRSKDSYFINARNQTYVKPIYKSALDGAYLFTVSTPFHDGVLVGRTNVEYLDLIISSSSSSSSKTSESLLAIIDADESITYFSKRKFSEHRYEILTKEQAQNRPIYLALMGEETVIHDLLNYRGVLVLSATNYIESLKIGMVTQVDEAEVFAPISRLQQLVFLILIVISFFVAFFVYILAKSISSDLNSLSRDIVLITKGDLNIQLKKSSIFEIQNLTDSLNRILATMKLAILRTGLNKGELGLGEAIKAKEEAEEKYKMIYETSLDARMTLEPPTWKFTSGNPAAFKMFGVKNEEEFTKLGPWDVSPAKQPDGQDSGKKAQQMIMKAMKEGKSFFAWTHKKYKGESFPATVLLSRFKLNGKDVVQATVRNLGEEKHKK